MSRDQPRYPIFVPSKGRWRHERALTVRALQRDQIPVRLVVEPGEADLYAPRLMDRDQLLVLPEDNFGLMRARNWIRDHAETEGYAKHHQLDDNIAGFYRFWNGRRVPCHGGVALRVLEDLVDRYQNVGVAGLSYDMMVPAKTPVPYFRNCHVYSCSLINHAMPYRWRLILNDDTDLCLQALVHGWATLTINAFLCKKVTTMTLDGGNTDSLYRNKGEARDTIGRFAMARVLERQWPGTVKTIRRFGRYQHSVNWRRFADVPLILREDVDLEVLPEVDEYDLSLRAIRDVKSERVRQLHLEYERDRSVMLGFDEIWRGLPAFKARPELPKLTVMFDTKEARDGLVRQLGVTVDKRFADKAWSAGWPPRGRDDPASLRFEPETLCGYCSRTDSE